MQDLFSEIETPERDELKALRKELEEANYKYYVLNQPTLSDQEFDFKMHRLQDLEAMFPDMFDPKSPTQHVGSDLDVQRDKGQSTKWDVHIVAIKNEVKELLLLSGGTGRITAIDLAEPEKVFRFSREEERQAVVSYSEYSEYSDKSENSERFLYEPNAAILKAGAYKLVGARYGLQKLDVNTHLYTSDQLVTDFPGRKWKIEQTVRDRKDLPTELTQANVLTRNYPLTPEQLKKKLHLRDGGTAYMIGARIQGKPMVLRATLIP